MMIRRRVLCAFAAVALLGGVISSAQLATAAPTQRQAAAPAQSAGTPPLGLPTAAADLVEETGRGRHSDVFGGVRLSDDQRQLEIDLTKPDSAIEADLLAAGGLAAGQVQFRTVRVTEAQQQAQHLRVTAAATALIRAGTAVRFWGTDFTTDGEVVILGRSTPTQVAAVRKAVGRDVAVRVDDGAALPQVAADRFNDTAPWNGGDFITDIGSGDCTSGVPTHTSNGGQYLVTAGHCFNLSANVFNYSSALKRGGRGYLGRVTNRSQADNDIDAELIFTPLSSLVWTGYTLNPTRTRIAGTAGSPRGAAVCHSGAFEGEICGFKVDANGCAPFLLPDNSIITYCRVLHASSTNPQAVGEGDSGGPVYRYINGGLRIVGTVTGLDGTTARCRNWYPQTTRTCGSGLWYTDWAAIAGKWSLYVGGLG